MSTRANVAGRHVRQRKLNPKQPLRILREGELEDTFDDEGQREYPPGGDGGREGRGNSKRPSPLTWSAHSLIPWLRNSIYKR